MNTPEREQYTAVVSLRDTNSITPNTFATMEGVVIKQTLCRLVAARNSMRGKRAVNDISSSPEKEQAEKEAATEGARPERLSFASSEGSTAAPENVAGSGLTTDGANGTTTALASGALDKFEAAARVFFYELVTEEPGLLREFSSNGITFPLIDDVHKSEPTAEDEDEDDEREDEYDERPDCEIVLTFHFTDADNDECSSDQKLETVVAAKVAHATRSLDHEVLEQIFILGCALAKRELKLSSQGLAAMCGARPKSMSPIAAGKELRTTNARKALGFLIAFFIIFKSTTLTVQDIFDLGVSRISRGELLKDPKNLSTGSRTSTGAKKNTGERWDLQHPRLLPNVKGKLRAVIMAIGDARFDVEHGEAIVVFTWDELVLLEDELSRKCVAFGEVAWKARALIYVRNTWVSGKGCLAIKKFWKVDNSKKITPPNDVARDAARDAAAAAAARHAGAATIA
jgi:hypothetical protein